MKITVYLVQTKSYCYAPFHGQFFLPVVSQGKQQENMHVAVTVEKVPA